MGVRSVELADEEEGGADPGLADAQPAATNAATSTAKRRRPVA
jgi:hypothetical protein